MPLIHDPQPYLRSPESTVPATHGLVEGLARIIALQVDDPQPPGYRWRLPTGEEAMALSPPSYLWALLAESMSSRRTAPPLTLKAFQELCCYRGGAWTNSGGCVSLALEGRQTIGPSWAQVRGRGWIAPTPADETPSRYIGFRLVRGAKL